MYLEQILGLMDHERQDELILVSLEIAKAGCFIVVSIIFVLDFVSHLFDNLPTRMPGIVLFPEAPFGKGYPPQQALRGPFALDEWQPDVLLVRLAG